MAENKRRGNPALKKGVVLNPKGRPKGSLNKYTLLAREMMTERGPEIVQMIMDKAMEGDVHCMKMCIDRILPVHKAVDPNKAKQDSQIVINVGNAGALEKKVEEVPPEKLKDPETKDDDAVIVEVSEKVKENQ